MKIAKHLVALLLAATPVMSAFADDRGDSMIMTLEENCGIRHEYSLSEIRSIDFTDTGRLIGQNLHLSNTDRCQFSYGITSIPLFLSRNLDDDAVTYRLETSFTDEQGNPLVDASGQPRPIPFTVPSEVTLETGVQDVVINITVDYDKIVPELPYYLHISVVSDTEVSYELPSTTFKLQYALWSSMSNHLKKTPTISDTQAFDWGYGSIMHARDVMYDDYVVKSSVYNWYNHWAAAKITLNQEYLVCQFPWVFFCNQISTINTTLLGIPEETTVEEMKFHRAEAQAFRAATYLDMARMYEFLPNGYVSGVNSYGNDVTGYTVPILTEKTSIEEAKNNPRVTHGDMVKFILSDLQAAAEAFNASSVQLNDKTMPSLAVVYGLMARTYLWDASYTAEGLPYQSGMTADEAYQKAAEYARLAITTSGATPLTRDEWLSTTNGFNTLSTPSWMWGFQYDSYDRSVTSALLTWTSWVSNEAQYGYASFASVQICKALFDKISDKDFRKLSYVAPEGAPTWGREKFANNYIADRFEPYYSLKFRPGQGETVYPEVANVVAVPLMRVEEMYLIEAEATANANPTKAVALINDFMRNYRDNTYSYTFTDSKALVDEIILQKRIELWGEGQIFFDYKRLNLDVTRSYSGTNVTESSELYNTTGRPAWMNFVITNSEGSYNTAITEWNNPPCGGVMQTVN